MGKSLTKHSARWLRLGAVFTMGVLSFSSVTVPSVSGERDDLVRQQQEAQRKRDELQIQIASLDKDLQAHILRLNDIQTQLPAAQAAADDAEAKAAAANRELQIITDQLNAAEGELQSLGKTIDDLGTESSRSDQALATMAREMYRSGGSSSPLLLALSTESTADVSQRATTAQSMARVQARALENARDKIAVTKNQEARQTALTKRIQGLQTKAADAAQKAENAAGVAQTKVLQLHSLQQEESTETAKLKARSTEITAQLNQQNAVVNTARAEIARIDEENHRKQIIFQQQQAAEAARRKAQQNAQANPGRPQGSTPPPPPVKPGGTFGYPLPSVYPVTSGFGPRYIPGLAASAYYHYGIDLGAPCGTPAIATANGVVTTANWDRYGGNWVIINYGLINGNSVQVFYMHFTRHNVYAGQRVNRGDVVGFVGTTGNSTGCHLHYEVHVNGVAVNPTPYM